MSSARDTVKWLLGAVLLGLLGWLLYINIEFYEETEQASWSSKALSNPYLAAQQFMERSGIDVRDVQGLGRLQELNNVGTLFFSDPGQIQTPRQLQQVLEWLQGGGNVLYAATAVGDEDDLLLAEVGVEAAWRDYDDDGDQQEKSVAETMREYNRQLAEGKTREQIAEQQEEEGISLTRVVFGDEIGDLEVAFDNEIVLAHAYVDDDDTSGAHQPFSWSSSDYGVHMMQFDIGSGLLTIVSDPQVWTSYSIDRHDHAYLLWLLSSDGGDFAMLRSVVRDTIWELMMRNASELLIAGTLLLLLWVWFRGARFGRLLPRDRSRRRALGEHFTSVAHYLWHRRDGAYLIAALRQQVLRRASLTLAGFAGADSRRQHELIAERCDLEANAIGRALGENNFNEATFVSTVRLLKRIEQAL